MSLETSRRALEISGPATRLVLLALLSVLPATGSLLQLTLSADFTPDTVTVGGSSTTIYTLTVTNPNDQDITNVVISDPSTTGLVRDAVWFGTCGTLATTGGGTGTFLSTGFSVSSNVLPAFTSCYQSIKMHATITGPIVNISNAVTSTELGTGPTASATLNSNPAESGVPAPPTIITVASGALVLLGRARRSLKT
jgi:hypothetical protein